MKQRIISALILAPLIIWGIFELPASGFLAFIGVVGLLASWEWAQLVTNQQRILHSLPIIIVSVAFVIISSMMQLEPIFLISILAVASAWWFIVCVLVVTYPNSSFWNNSITMKHLAGIFTVIPFMLSVVLLRTYGNAQEAYLGAKLVLFVCLLVWGADIGAYFTGKAIGKHKMAPSVSPNKTLEGLAGGILLSFVVGLGALKLMSIPFDGIMSILLITIITVTVSVFGDLAESMFKRVAGIKDSGNLIPGHGGILDRIDSLMAAFPVFTFLYLFFTSSLNF